MDAGVSGDNIGDGSAGGGGAINWGGDNGDYCVIEKGSDDSDYGDANAILILWWWRWLS